MPRIPRRLLVCLAALALWAAPVPAAVPGSVNFQGLLLDDQGDPVTGPVALVLRLYDAEENGTLLWTESHVDVDVLDGVYAVELGANTPLTSGILATPALYLEVEVEGDTLAPRQRLLAVPYALRAGEAETAASVGTLPSGFVTELIEHVNLDGGGPSNLSPLEGLADVDGNGIANFVDPDNDGDGITDIAEVAQGSDINVVTPTITGFAPPTADGFTTTSVEVQGTNFVEPLSVVFGSETPTPTNLTSTSFDVDVGPQAEGTASVQMTLANGEFATSSFDFFLVSPAITGFDPPTANGLETTTVEVQGTDFIEPLSVVFGSETPTPTNVTSTSFNVDVGPQPEGTVAVQVTNANGKSDNASFDFFFITPAIGTLIPSKSLPTVTKTVTVLGEGFEPGLTISFGSLTPTPYNLTPTSFQVDVGPNPGGEEVVVVSATNPNGKSGTSSYEFTTDLLRRVFVTSGIYGGAALGGVAGADALCASAGASLGGGFLAWIGDGTIDPAGRFEPGFGPYERVDGTVVADDWADLTDGTLDAPIDRTQSGSMVSAAFVWTGVAGDGTSLPGGTANCDAWTNPAQTGRTGRTDRTDSGWTSQSTTLCSSSARLYCVEQ